ncbi:hypothetical protein, partial [Anaerotignum sp.]|uniref:hypothetical protein n=1 Tax=Anaerotignum sp. TaxID=2039241 RepID=UPI0039940D3E
YGGKLGDAHLFFIAQFTQFAAVELGHGFLLDEMIFENFYHFIIFSGREQGTGIFFLSLSKGGQMRKNSRFSPSFVAKSRCLCYDV